MKKELDFYRNKKVLITGNTGFKGAWLTKILLLVGADVIGYSLEPATDPSLYHLLGYDVSITNVLNHNEGRLHTVISDVRDYDSLSEVFNEAKPEIVFHLAAQPIVRESYKDPRGTYETNVMGTVNVCECVRHSDNTRSFLNVTTDKVYRNNEWSRGYREDDELDGYDPYSNSKSCSELVTHSYTRSFFEGSEKAVSTARAGNVIGGGDFSKDRIIPDCVRAVEKGEPLTIRNPHSVRPYQHVLEPLFMYLRIAAEQYDDPSKAGSYNIGPDYSDCITTEELVGLFSKYWLETGSEREFVSEIHADTTAPHEAGLLKLDTSLIKSTFGYRPTWRIEEAIANTVEWTAAWIKDPTVDSIDRIMEEQIMRFTAERNAG